MPYKLKDPVRHKFTKKSYNKRDWKVYEEGLRNRGDLTIWFCEDAIAIQAFQKSIASQETVTQRFCCHYC
jgi:hypothetical protein